MGATVVDRIHWPRARAGSVLTGPSARTARFSAVVSCSCGASDAPVHAACEHGACECTSVMVHTHASQSVTFTEGCHTHNQAHVGPTSTQDPGQWFTCLVRPRHGATDRPRLRGALSPATSLTSPRSLHRRRGREGVSMQRTPRVVHMNPSALAESYDGRGVFVSAAVSANVSRSYSPARGVT